MNKRLWVPFSTIVLLLAAACLLIGLVPVSDLDFDGAPDTFQTEGSLIFWAHALGMLVIFLLNLFWGVRLNARQHDPFLFDPPPISSHRSRPDRIPACPVKHCTGM